MDRYTASFCLSREEAEAPALEISVKRAPGINSDQGKGTKPREMLRVPGSQLAAMVCLVKAPEKMRIWLFPEGPLREMPALGFKSLPLRPWFFFLQIKASPGGKG